MKNRKRQVQKAVVVTVIVVLMLLTISFFVSNNRTVGNQEAVEAFYGRGIFGGRFAWLDNVKRPGFSTGVGVRGAPAFDFSSDESLLDRMVDPTAGMKPMTPGGLPFTTNYGPFSDNPNRDPIVEIQHVRLPEVDVFGDRGGDGNNGGYGDDPGDPNDPDPDPPVVPVPGAASLALIGVLVGSVLRRRRR